MFNPIFKLTSQLVIQLSFIFVLIANTSVKQNTFFNEFAVYIPNEIFPVPVLSNNWKATIKRASGAHSTDSKARNSWKDMSLCGQEKKAQSQLWECLIFIILWNEMSFLLTPIKASKLKLNIRHKNVTFS